MLKSFASHHKMQSFHKAFIGTLKAPYCQEIGKWFCSHPGRIVTVYQIGELFGNAYKRAATGETAPNGFRVKGLFPRDKNTFRPQISLCPQRTNMLLLRTIPLW